jgi:hypothetical protein
VAVHQEFLAEVPAVLGITTGRFTEPDEVAQLIASGCYDLGRNVA